MRNFQGIVFISTQTFKEIFTSVLVYLEAAKNAKKNKKVLTGFRITKY